MHGKTLSLDRLVSVFASLAAVILPLLVKDHVLAGRAADIVSTAVGALLVGYHIPPGIVVGGRDVSTEQIQTVAQDIIEELDPGASVADPSQSGMAQEQAGSAA